MSFHDNRDFVCPTEWLSGNLYFGCRNWPRGQKARMNEIRREIHLFSSGFRLRFIEISQFSQIFSNVNSDLSL